METETRFELYIQNKLADNQKKELEARFRKDMAFKAMFEDYCQRRKENIDPSALSATETGLSGSTARSVSMNEVMEDIEKYGPSRATNADEREFLHTVREVSADYHEKRTSRVNLFAAAAIVLLVVLSTVFMFMHRKSSPETLYAANYLVYPYVLQTRGDQAPADPALVHGLDLYTQGEYKQAADILSKTSAIQQGSPLETLYLGVCYIETGNLQQAFAVLSRISSSSPNIASHQANWYLGLLCLKTNDIGKAKFYFSQEAGSNSAYAEKARLILKNLN